jgi:hypothetical protein
LWNIRHCLRKAGLNAFNDIKECTKFYDFKSIINFFMEVEPDVTNKKLLDIAKYDNYQMLMLTDKKDICASFKDYSVKHLLIDDINTLLTRKEKYNKIYDQICEGGNTFEVIVYKHLLETVVVRLGIAFQRWKIILEKMCDSAKEKNDPYMKAVYCVDKLLTNLQEMIMLYVKHIVNLIKLSFTLEDVSIFNDNCKVIPNIYDNCKYKLIYECIIADDFLLHVRHDPTIIGQNDNDTLKKIELLCVNKSL